MDESRVTHPVELLERYAFGTLDRAQRNAVDAHALVCPDCARRLGEAEAAVSALVPIAATVPQRLRLRIRASLEKPHSVSRGFSWVALAAAFIVGLVPFAIVWQRDRARHAAAIAMAPMAVHALVDSHFLHVEFVRIEREAPRAKLIYARNGEWLYVLADAARTYAVVGTTTHGARVVLGVLAGDGSERTLFIARTPRLREVALFEGPTEVARATLEYPTSRPGPARGKR